MISALRILIWAFLPVVVGRRSRAVGSASR